MDKDMLRSCQDSCNEITPRITAVIANKLTEDEEEINHVVILDRDIAAYALDVVELIILIF